MRLTRRVVLPVPAPATTTTFWSKIVSASSRCCRSGMSDTLLILHLENSQGLERSGFRRAIGAPPCRLMIASAGDAKVAGIAIGVRHNEKATGTDAFHQTPEGLPQTVAMGRRPQGGFERGTDNRRRPKRRQEEELHLGRPRLTWNFQTRIHRRLEAISAGRGLKQVSIFRLWRRADFKFVIHNAKLIGPRAPVDAIDAPMNFERRSALRQGRQPSGRLDFKRHRHERINR